MKERRKRLKKGERIRVLETNVGEEAVYGVKGDILEFGYYVGYDNLIAVKFIHVEQHPDREGWPVNKYWDDWGGHRKPADFEDMRAYLISPQTWDDDEADIYDEYPWYIDRYRVGPEVVEYQLDQILDEDEGLL